MMDWRDNATQIKHDFDRDGYIILRSYLSAEATAAVAENVERYVSDVLPGLPSDLAYYEVKSETETIMRLNSMTDRDSYFQELI